MVSEIVIGSAPTGADFTLGGIARVDAQVTLTPAPISVATGKVDVLGGLASGNGRQR